jgi:hypothetical protein
MNHRYPMQGASMRINTYTALFCLVLLSGCGMSDYEKRLDEQRVRIANFDEVNRLLGEPIDMFGTKSPEGKDEPAWRVDFYLRLPKGYGKLPKDKSPYYPPFPCYRYVAEDNKYSIFVAANLLPDPKGKRKPQIGEYSKTLFRTFLRLAIADYYEKTTKLKLNLPEKVKAQERLVTAATPYPDATPKIKYDVITFTDQNNKQAANPTQFDVYVHDGAGGKQVAIIAQHPVKMTPADTFDKHLEACLGSLDVGPEAAIKRAEFKPAR